MERDKALKLLENFILTELRAKLSAGSFYQINGDRICSKCRSSNRRTLYMIISDNMPVMLKCFRASCLLEHIIENPEIDANKARPITREELLGLGFQNNDAIEAILDCKNLIYSKNRKFMNDNIMISDTTLSSEQLGYIQDRCGFKPTLGEISKYHIISNVSQIIEDNDIQMDDTMASIYGKYNKSNSLTFLCGGLTLSTRALTKYALQKSILNVNPNVTALGYNIGSKTEGNHTLVISEGIYDIINAERYIANYGGDKKGVLYIATLGFAKTLHIIEHYYYKNIDTIKDLVIFMDSDICTETDGIKSYTYNEVQLYKLLKSLDMSLGMDAFKSISICYNTKSKDCGDLREPLNPKRIDIDKFKLYSKFVNKRR